MNLLPEESDEQIAFVQWLELKRIKFTSIPNSTWTKSNNQKRKNYYEGLRKGFPDMIVICPCGDGKKRLLAIEMKRIKGGVLSPEQKDWINEINECEQAGAYCCRGADEAIRLMSELMSRKDF